MAIGGLVMGYVAIALAVTVVPLLLSIAIPNFVTARKQAQHNVCVGTLRAIEGAKASWAEDKKKAPKDVPNDSDIFGADKYIRENPVCPAGGTYSLNAVNDKPTCSIHGQSP